MFLSVYHLFLHLPICASDHHSSKGVRLSSPAACIVGSQVAAASRSKEFITWVKHQPFFPSSSSFFFYWRGVGVIPRCTLLKSIYISSFGFTMGVPYLKIERVCLDNYNWVVAKFSNRFWLHKDSLVHSLLESLAQKKGSKNTRKYEVLILSVTEKFM